jgi:hypothetical protein
MAAAVTRVAVTGVKGRVEPVRKYVKHSIPDGGV